MSDANIPPVPPGPPPVPPPASMPPLPPRSGWMTGFMVIVGIVLLLPGLCAIVFGVGSLSGSSYDSGFTPFIVVGLLVGFGGIMLIRAAIRGPQR
jgi:hypothetical protein